MIEKSYRKYFGIFAILILFTTPILLASHPTFATAASTGVVIPLYVDPGTDWNQVIQAKNAHPSVPIVAVINPNNGPGSSISSSYVTGIQQLQSAGVIVLGYVHTSYGSRSTSTLESEINSYNNWYHVNGILFDEMANTAGYETYYSNLSSYVKSHGMPMTMGNPGTDTLPSYIGTVDNLCIYENPGLPTVSDLGSLVTIYPKTNFCMIAIGVGQPSQSYITNISKYVSYLFITDANLPNPYDVLPSYFSNEVAMLDTSATATVPQPPTNLAATAVSSSQINLSWTAPSSNGGSPITGYEIERSTNGGSTWSILVANTGSTGTTYSNNGLTASTTYTYKVLAINSVGPSLASNTSSATTSATATVPQPPTNLAANAVSSSQINLSWTAPSSNGGSPITGYEIDRSTNSSSTWSTIVSNTGSTTTIYSNTGLNPSTIYTYRVSAISSVGTGSPSNTASATTSSGTASTIVLNGIQTTSGTVSSSPYQITLSNFNAGTGSNRVLVVGVEANNNDAASITFGGVQLTKKVQSFSNNDAEFWYLVNPVGTGNIVVTMVGSTSVVVGAYSISGVDQTNPMPTTATNYNTAASSPAISITTANSNSLVLDLPSIYGGVTLGSPTCTQNWDATLPGAITGASSSTIQASPGSLTCSWTANAGDFWDDAAVEVKASSISATAPGSPTGLVATAVSSSQINLSWTAPSSNGGSPITGYEIERSTNGGSTWSILVANTGSTGTTYSNNGLTASTTYTYKVLAINSVGPSLASNTSSATTKSSTSNAVSLTVKSVDLSGTSFSGMWVELHASNGVTLATGYTPVTFKVTSGLQYSVYAANYQNYVFSHWSNGSTNPTITVTPTQNTTLVAYYNT